MNPHGPPGGSAREGDTPTLQRSVRPQMKNFKDAFTFLPTEFRSASGADSDFPASPLHDANGKVGLGLEREPHIICKEPIKQRGAQVRARGDLDDRKVSR